MYQCPWDVVKGKITKSLLAIENGVIVEESSIEYELDRAKRPLNLYAVANGSRFRLLLSSIEQLEKEVGTGSICLTPNSLFPCCQFSFRHVVCFQTVDTRNMKHDASNVEEY